MSNAAAAAVHKPAIAEIDIASIDANPDNPRRVFKRIEELAQSVKERGILVPIRLRPVGARFQLVFGERRWRAAKLAGVKTIPSIVEQLTDKEVLELMLIELANDEDVSPLEQSETFQKLLKHGNTPDDIAAKTGLSKRVVYERLQLAKLGPEGKKALAEEKINASVALLIARIPAELQAQAVKDVADDQSALSYRAAAEHIHKNFMLQLKDAPFDVTDAKLVAKAGACSACPKRTGNQRELFGDVKSPDVCTDPKCYQGKEDALWQIKVKEAEGKGQKVIDGAEAKKLFPYGDAQLGYNVQFKKLDDDVWTGSKSVKVKALLGKDGAESVLARTPEGQVVELVPAAAVGKKLKELEPDRPIGRLSGDDDRQAKFRKQQLLRGKVCTEGLGLLTEKVEADKAGRKTLMFVARSLFSGGYYDGTRRAAKRRGVEPESLKGKIAAMTDAGLAGLIVEVVAGDNASGGAWGGGYGGRFTEACKVFGVDVKKIEAQEKGAKKAKAVKAPAPAKKAKKKAATKSGKAKAKVAKKKPGKK